MSYGDISILTRSPTVRRTQRLRILPEMVARTKCLLSNSTRNMVPGSTVWMLPSISMLSSFINRQRHDKSGQHSQSGAGREDYKAEQGPEMRDNSRRCGSIPVAATAAATATTAASAAATVAASATTAAAAARTFLTRSGDIDCQRPPAQFFAI